MNLSNEILAELSEISPSLAISALGHPFTVPADYFSILPTEILAAVEAELAVPVKTASPYTIPANYFSSLADNIVSGVQAASSEKFDDLAGIAPVLSGIDKGETYQVPARYFSENAVLLSGVVQRSEKRKPAIIKSLRRLMQYAAAAVVGGILVTGAFIYTDSKSYLEQEMVRKPSLNKVMVVPSTANALVPEVPADEEKINQAVETGEETPKPNDEIRLTDFAKKIQLLSDEELKKYLDENTVPEPVSLLNDASEI
jgi:hypothetical protein